MVSVGMIPVLREVRKFAMFAFAGSTKSSVSTVPISKETLVIHTIAIERVC